MAKQLINTGSSQNKGDGDPLRTAFTKINENFDELYAVNGDISGAASDVLPATDGTVNLGSADKAWAEVFIADYIYLNGAKIEVTPGGSLLVNGGAPAEVQDTVGSVFADDSTLLVDGVNGTIPAANLTGTLPALDGSALTGVTANSIAFADVTATPTTLAGYGITDAVTAGGDFEGNLSGSVFADDSTLLVDGVNGTIPAANLTGVLPALDASNLINLPAGTANSLVGDMKGSVFADDSTLLVDGVNGTLNATALTGALPAIDGSALIGVQSTLVSGTDIKTINGQSLLGSGNITISGGGSGGGSAFTNIGVGADDSTIRSIGEGESFLILGGTGITTASDAEGNITITGIDAYTKAEVDSSIASVTAGHFDFNITGDDSTVRTVAKGDTLQIVGGTAITTASDADGNITINGVAQDFAFSSLTGTPTTLSGYGITDALTAGGALTGSSLEAEAVGAGVADGNDLAISGGDATELNSTGGDANITGGSGALQPGNVNIGATQTTLVTIGSGSNNVDFPNGTTVDFTGTTVTGLPAAYSDSDVDTHLNQSTAGTNEVLSWDGADYAWVAQSSGGSGLQSRSTATGTTSSLADAAEADLDITGFKSYALLAITTDRAARVRLYVTDATRTADASRAEGVDPTSDAGLIAEVITTGAETVIISPGAFGFNLESSPTTTIPCRVTNKSGGTSTVQVDLNILQLEA